MRLRGAGLGLLVALAACGSSSAASHGSSTGATTKPSATTGPGTSTQPGSSTRPVNASCGPRAAKTLALDRRARVYVRQGVVYGCANGGRAAYALGYDPQTRPGQARVGVVALAGVVVAYGASRMGVDTSGAMVIVRRLTDGGTLRTLRATTLPPEVEGFQVVDAIVVRPDGAVAWIATSGSIIHAGSRRNEVDRADSRGEARLDAGAGIVIHSLRRHGSTVTWRHGSTIRSAPLR